MSCYGIIFLSFSSYPGLETDFKATDVIMFDLLTYKRGLSQPKALPYLQGQAKQKWWDSILPVIIPVENSPVVQVEK